MDTLNSKQSSSGLADERALAAEMGVPIDEARQYLNENSAALKSLGSVPPTQEVEGLDSNPSSVQNQLLQLQKQAQELAEREQRIKEREMQLDMEVAKRVEQKMQQILRDTSDSSEIPKSQSLLNRDCELLCPEQSNDCFSRVAVDHALMEIDGDGIELIRFLYKSIAYGPKLPYFEGTPKFALRGLNFVESNVENIIVGECQTKREKCRGCLDCLVLVFCARLPPCSICSK
jgi:DNA-binding transcriptional MerR regulator